MTIPFANGRQSMEAVYGINPIKVLIAKQKTPLRKIIIAGGRGGLSVKEIIDSARQKKIPVEWKERQYLDELTGRSDHQGIVGFRDSFAYTQAEDLRGINQLIVHFQIRIAGTDVPAGVIVCQNHGGGPVGYCVRKYFAWMNLAAVQQADRDNAFFNHFVGAVKGNTHEMFLRFGGNIL